jgi:hypothetical protein
MMPSDRTSPSKKSRGSAKTKEHPGGASNRPPRAQRADTPEAAEQRKRSAKTHPTRAKGARRKDK